MAENFAGKIHDDLRQADSAGRSMFSSLRSGAASFHGTWQSQVQTPISNTADKVQEISSELGGMTGVLAGIGASMLRFMFNPLTLVVGLLATAVKRLNETEANAMNTSRAFGSVQQGVSQFQASTQDLVDKWRHLGVNAEQVNGIISGIANSMRDTRQVSTAAVAEITQLALHGGASKDEFTSAYSAILQMSQGLAKSKDEADRMARSALNYANNLAMANGVPINQMMSQLSNISDAVASTMGANPQALSQAVVQASQLGTTLEGVASIMNNALNVEQSIANEMEASVLLGKNLNLEKLRAASFAGDEVSVMRELQSLVGSQAEFEKMLPIQRQAYAQALGMSVSEMQRMMGFETQAEIQAKKRQEANDHLVSVATTTMEKMNYVIKQIGIEFARVMEGPVQQFRTWLTTGVEGQTGLDRLVGAARSLAGGLQQAVQWIQEFWAGGNRMQNLRDLMSGVGQALMQVINWLGQGEGKWKNWQIVMAGIAAVKLAPIVSTLGRITMGLGSVQQGAAGASMGFGQMLGKLGSVYMMFQNIKDISSGQGMRGMMGMAGMALGGMAFGPMGALAGGYLGRHFGGTVGDAIIRPGAAPINVHPSDTLIAVKEAGGGASYISHRGEGLMGKTPPQPITYNFDLGPVSARLDALISIIKTGGKVYVDGVAVGRHQAFAATGAG